MTTKQMLQAIPVLQTLVNYKLPMKTTYALYNLAKKINEQKEFFVNKEKELIEKYKGNLNGQGQISFEKSEDFQAFAKEYNELNDVEVDIGGVPVSIRFDDMGDQTLSAADIMNLEGVVEFVE